MAITLDTSSTVAATVTAPSQAFRHIASGQRVNRAADDPAALGVATNLDAANRGASAASRNTHDAISVTEVADGASAQVGDLLTRVRELAVQAASDTLSPNARQAVQDEANALISEVDRIAQTTEFNGISLTDGSQASLDAQVDDVSSADGQIGVSLGDLSSGALGLGGIDLSTSAGARAALDQVDGALDTVSGYRSEYGASQSRLSTTLETLDDRALTLEAARSRIQDADLAKASALQARQTLLADIGVSVQAQANRLKSHAVSLLG